MITFICSLIVKPEHASAFEALMGHVRDMTLAHEPGVAHYGFARSVETPNAYVVVEVYRDPAAHAAHMATQWVRDSLPQSMAMIDGKPDIRQYVTPGTEPAVRQTRF